MSEVSLNDVKRNQFTAGLVGMIEPTKPKSICETIRREHLAMESFINPILTGHSLLLLATFAAVFGSPTIVLVAYMN